MNTLDKLINYFVPARGAARARARHATRAYEGAAGGRRGSSWQATGQSANSELSLGLKPLRDRARELGRNNPIIARMLDVIPAHIVGTGIRPVSSIGSDKLDRMVNKLWSDWVEQADVTGRLNYYAMQVLAVRSMIETGEVVVRLIDRMMGEENLAVPFQLQLLEGDYIDHYRDGIYGGGFGVDKDAAMQKTRLGVALGEYDAVVGLWLWPYHPGEVTTINPIALTSTFVPKDQLLHMFKVARPGQVRGVSWLAPVMMSVRDMADFIDAVNVKARVEACFSGFITNDDSTMPLLEPNTSGIDPALDGNLPGAQITSLEPGLLKELRSGQDIKFAAPSSTGQIEPVLMYNLQMIAAGVGCTYDQATGDLRQANYSSLRAGKLDFWKLISEWQEHTVIPMFCKPVWDRFISRAILSGALKPRKGGYPCNWIKPAREAVDPKKDLDAEKNEVRSGRMTPQEFIASKGGDWRVSIDQFAEFFDAADEKKMVFDIDVRQVDQHGRKPTRPSTTPGHDEELAQATLDATDQAADDAEADVDDTGVDGDE